MDIQIELSELVFRVEVPEFPDDEELWDKFMDLLLQSEINLEGEEIDHEGPGDRFYIRTDSDTDRWAVYRVVEEILEELGIRSNVTTRPE